jgi:prepilin-type N-terminal cleavage/methylation domain-containing protein
MHLEPHNDRPIPGLRAWFFRSRAAGYSFVEMLVALALVAVVLVAAVLAFQAIGTFSERRSGFETITFSSNGVMTNFYGTNTNSITTWSAPTYGHLARVELLRDKFYEDQQKSMAVYCLPRVGRSSFRVTSIPVPTNSSYAIGTYDYRNLSTPEAFRVFLADRLPSESSAFEANAFSTNGVGGRNLSVVMLRKSTSRTNLNVQCIYEVDFVRADSPGGIYSSVRRYEGTVLTDYYDVFYPDLPAAAVNSDYFFVAANFERSVRPSTSASVANVAAAQPFSFVWWPDPASARLPTSAGSYSNAMRNQTSLLFVTPMFPSL